MYSEQGCGAPINYLMNCNRHVLPAQDRASNAGQGWPNRFNPVSCTTRSGCVLLNNRPSFALSQQVLQE